MQNSQRPLNLLNTTPHNLHLLLTLLPKRPPTRIQPLQLRPQRPQIIQHSPLLHSLTRRRRQTPTRRHRRNRKPHHLPREIKHPEYIILHTQTHTQRLQLLSSFVVRQERARDEVVREEGRFHEFLAPARDLAGVTPGVEAAEVCGDGAEVGCDGFVVGFVGFLDVLGEGGVEGADSAEVVVSSWGVCGDE